MIVLVVLQQVSSSIFHQRGFTTSWWDSKAASLHGPSSGSGLVFLLWRLLLVSICASRQPGAACETAAEPRDVTSCPAFQGLKENR